MLAILPPVLAQCLACRGYRPEIPDQFTGVPVPSKKVSKVGLKRATAAPERATAAVKLPVKRPLLYETLVSALRSEILLGAYPVNTPLPSESALVARFDVSRHTVRDALRHLRDLGLVQSRQGRGTLVVHAQGPAQYVHHVSDISELHDFNVDSRYDKVPKKLENSAELRDRLGSDASESWLRVDGIRFDRLTNAPICVVEIFVPAQFAGVGRLLGRREGPIYSLIEEVYGERIGEVQQKLRALTAPPAVALALALDADATVVEIKRIYRLLHGQVAEITFNYYAAEQFSFSMTLRRVSNQESQGLVPRAGK